MKYDYMLRSKLAIIVRIPDILLILHALYASLEFGTGCDEVSLMFPARLQARQTAAIVSSICGPDRISCPVQPSVRNFKDVNIDIE